MFHTVGSSDVGSVGRVLVLGLDGATFSLIEPMAKSGRLPNLARLMEEGAWLFRPSKAGKLRRRAQWILLR